MVFKAKYKYKEGTNLTENELKVKKAMKKKVSEKF